MVHVADITAEQGYIERAIPNTLPPSNLEGVRTYAGCPNAEGERTDRCVSDVSGKKSVPSPTSRSSWSRTSPPKPSSPSRTRGCSTNCASRCSSRPPPPTCSRSSAARPSTCRPCSTRWSSRRHGFARPTSVTIYRARDGAYVSRCELRLLARIRAVRVRSHPIAARREDQCYWASRAGRQSQFTSRTCWPIREYALGRPAGRLATIAPCLGVPLLREGYADRRLRLDARYECSHSPKSRSSWSRPSPTRR